jgi:cell wall-associated NlpC family hydrolase
MSKTSYAERTHRPVLNFVQICLSLFAVIILAACNSSAAGNSFSREMSARSSAPRAVSADGNVIDLISCTQGLRGSLSTARAGQGLLADNGLADSLEGTGMSVPSPESGDYVDPAPSAVTSVQVKANATGALLMAAYGQTGRHYKSGGQTPAAGFDAPGFTRWVYSQRGISIPKAAKRQASGGRQIAKEDLRPGDLLVYRDPAERDSYHVGIYTGKGNFLHAAAKSGVVTETDAFGPQFSPYFVGARRYYDDPKAAPLSDAQKMTAASSAVKTDLLELGPDDQPERKAYSKPKKRTSKARRSSKRRR